jgi:hypothetical protein
MDRREALRLIGATGVTVAGVSAISTGVAFAYKAPVIDSGMGASVSNTGTLISLQIQPGFASCSGSTTNVDGAEVTRLDMILSTVSIEAGKHFGAAGYGSTSLVTASANDFTGAPFSTTLNNPPTSMVGGVAFSYGIRKFNPGPPANTTGVVMLAGDSFSVQMLITYSCSYAGGSATVTESFDATYTYAGVGQWTYTPGANI